MPPRKRKIGRKVKPPVVRLGRRRYDGMYILAYRRNATWEANNGFRYSEGVIRSFCSDDFHRITRFRLKPGECIEVRIPIERVRVGKL